MAETREDLLQDLALKLDLANMELQTIDEVLARRPALANLKHRTEKIERACQAASDMDKALRECLPQLRWADCHGSRCPELLAEIEYILSKSGGEEQKQP